MENLQPPSLFGLLKQLLWPLELIHQLLPGLCFQSQGNYCQQSHQQAELEYLLHQRSQRLFVHSR